jgi:phosphoglycerate dehydrogenase-like enzyme
VAQLAEAFGMRVIVAAHRGNEGPGLRELLAASDIVSLHVPLTPATRGMIGAAELACMRRGARLVNTARGALIDMPALRAALASGQLGGFAADVLDVEPPAKDDALLGLPNVILTPHVASLTAATYRTLCLSTAANVVRVLRGEPPEPRSVFRQH